MERHHFSEYRFLESASHRVRTTGSARVPSSCSSGCSTGLRIKSTGSLTNDRPLWYVRDPATGFVQTWVRLQDGTVRTGARVNVGCSSISFSDVNMTTKSAHICVECTLINSFSNACTCVCPVYPIPSTA